MPKIEKRVDKGTNIVFDAASACGAGVNVSRRSASVNAMPHVVFFFFDNDKKKKKKNIYVISNIFSSHPMKSKCFSSVKKKIKKKLIQPKC
jgi:hypothetical protein